MSDPGPAWLTGGAFGIEGSVWILPAQLALSLWLFRRCRNGHESDVVDTIDRSGSGPKEMQ